MCGLQLLVCCNTPIVSRHTAKKRTHWLVSENDMGAAFHLSDAMLSSSLFNNAPNDGDVSAISYGVLFPGSAWRWTEKRKSEKTLRNF
jgi:hypothetical protein